MPLSATEETILGHKIIVVFIQCDLCHKDTYFAQTYFVRIQDHNEYETFMDEIQRRYPRGEHQDFYSYMHLTKDNMHNDGTFHDWGGDHIAKDDEFFCDFDGDFMGLSAVSKSLNLKEGDAVCCDCMRLQEKEYKMRHIWSH